MDTTITLGEGLLLIIGLMVILLIAYLIRVLRACLPTIKALTGILEDTQKLTSMTANAAEELEQSVTSLAESSVDMAEFISNNQNSFKAIVSLVNAVVSIKKLLF